MVTEAVDLETARRGIRKDTSIDVGGQAAEEEAEDEEDNEDGDSTSVASSATSCSDKNNEGALVLNEVVQEQERSACFQNIEVTNSSDVHFGNKTYYQGPVTIKQILYTNPSPNRDENSVNNGGGFTSDGGVISGGEQGKLPIANGTDNNGFVPEFAAVEVVAKNASNNNNNSNWMRKSKGKEWLQNASNKKILIVTAALIFTVVCVIATTILLLIRYLPENKPSSERPFYTGEELQSNVPNNDPEGTVHIIGRRGWVAEPPANDEPLLQPVSKVLIVETSTENCTVQGDCVFLVRHLQSNHKEGNSLWDIRYNFLVGGDGNAYEGRGWTAVGATLPKCNANAIGIAFIGTFSYIEPPKEQANVARRLIALGVKLGHISPNYTVVYSSQVLHQAGIGVSSGKKLEEVVQSWPHWSNVDYYKDDTLKQKFCTS